MENTSIEIEIGWRFHNIFVELHVAIEVDEVRCALCAVRCTATDNYYFIVGTVPFLVVSVSFAICAV